MRQTFDSVFNYLNDMVCVCVYTSETYISVTCFALFGHCHYLLTDPRKNGQCRLSRKR